jgi:hypothetical protein
VTRSWTGGSVLNHDASPAGTRSSPLADHLRNGRNRIRHGLMLNFVPNRAVVSEAS